MLRQRKLRDRLVAIAAPPILVSTAAAVGTLLVADGDRPTVALIALAVTVGAAVWSFLVGWALIRSINSLAIATDGVAEAQLSIANGQLEASELPTIDHQGPEDEIGRVAQAVDAVSVSAVQMAESQRENIRKGLATIVINLARRNQSLLDRQVEYLDQLEQTEEDPDRLGQLFRVDHLATRMRRNAESLLVLAGADTAKRKGAPVAMSDVLRVAIGEVENYQHIELGVVEDGEVPAGVAVDLAHLTAELMENATQFSPPSTIVGVSAVVDRPTQSVHISVADRGMGLGDRLEHANQTLADPPELGLGMGRSLGFMVIGRLAKRLGAVVELRANDGGGTVAEVRVPLSLFQLEEPGHAAAPDQQPPASSQAPTPVAPSQPAQRTTQAPAPAPAPADSSQAAASTALDKLLGIAPPATTPPVSQPTPAPAPEPALRDPALDPTSGLDGAVPAGEALPPPADDPTWGSMNVGSGPAAEVPPASPSAVTPPPAGDPAAARGIPDLPIAQDSGSPEGWTPPPMPPPSSASGGTWTPPPMPPPRPVDETWAPPPAAPVPTTPAQPPSRFDEAVPSGDAFESGVASLLGSAASPPAGSDQHPSSTGWPDTSPQVSEPPAGLQKRERGASNVPIGQGRPVAAPTRSPEEVRAMLSRYRDGLKGKGNQAPPPGATPADHDDRDGER